MPPQRAHSFATSSAGPTSRMRRAAVRGCGSSQPGAGWLIFKTGRSEMGVHPTHSVYDGKTYEAPRHHLISLMCDDISHTVAELKGKGAEFRGEVQDHGYGLVVMMAVPGADDIMLYEPRHPLAYSL